MPTISWSFILALKGDSETFSFTSVIVVKVITIWEAIQKRGNVSMQYIEEMQKRKQNGLQRQLLQAQS